MWIHKTTAKVEQQNKDKLIAMLSTEKVFDLFREHAGFQAYYLVDKLSDPDEMASITIWDTQEDGEDLYASPEYREVLSGAVPLLVGKPEMETFTVKVECRTLISSLN